jgi:DNA-directed RNA polymerase subunit beta'
MVARQKFDYIKVNLASPERIRHWGERTLPNGKKVGEVTVDEILNYETMKPQMGGLHCERNFGPIKDWTCHCGVYKGGFTENIFCEYCEVEITKSIVRRQRMGFIELAAPVVHPWYIQGQTNAVSLILDLSAENIEKIIYFDAVVVISPGKNKKVRLKEVFPVNDPIFSSAKGDLEGVRFSTGPEAIKALLNQIDLQREERTLRLMLNQGLKGTQAKAISNKRLIKRLRLINHFLASGAKPSWMVLDVLPVLPPDLRPIINIGKRHFATTDLNSLYQTIVIRNNRLSLLKSLLAPESMLQSEKILLQRAVNALIHADNEGKEEMVYNKRPLKSLSDVLKGKEGRFRQNLLGKRVDYSARSVIVVGPELRLHQCGLPYEIASELFKPFVLHWLYHKNIVNNFSEATEILESNKPIVCKALCQIMEGHPVLLNRAPTLHRLGVQAFEPILVEGSAIKLHPLVCTAFNADFDGDQMAVHIPLSLEAQAEAHMLMLAPKNFLSPASGEPILSPTQDMILGCYYLTMNNPTAQQSKDFYFSGFEEMIRAYNQGKVSLHTFAWVRCDKKDHKLLRIQEKEKNLLPGQVNFLSPNLQVKACPNGNIVQMYLKTTPGRVLLNQSFEHIKI